MPKKLSIEQITERLREFNSNIEILDKEYIGTNSKLKFRCKLDGHVWENSWDRMSQSKKCPMCSLLFRAPNRLMTINEVKIKLKHLNPTLTILDSEYLGTQSKMHIKCNLCDFEYYRSWSVLKNSEKCPNCQPRDGGKNRMFDMTEIKDRLYKISPTIKVVDENYYGARIKFKCKCKTCYNEWMAAWETLSKGIGCPKCSKATASKKRMLSLKKVKERLKDISPNIRIVDTEYSGTRSKIRCECLSDSCGNIWTPTVSDLFKGAGCPVCAKQYLNSTIGCYNTTLVEKHKEVCLLTNSIVYIIECWNDFEHFYKVGLTTKTVKERFLGNREMPYHYKVLDEIEMNVYNATYMEKLIIESNVKYKYIPQIKMGGYTECFSKITYTKDNNEVTYGRVDRK